MRTRLLSLIVLAGALAACRRDEPRPVSLAEPPPRRGSREWKIQNARSAAPPVIGQYATVMDWPASDTAEPERLALGTGGWICWPDDPATPPLDPVCMDDVMTQWHRALRLRQAPIVESMGIGYRLRGGAAVNDRDPMRWLPDSSGWITEPPHLMIVVPDPVRAFRNLATDRTDAGPWVKWRGTRYAHLIVPAGR